MGLEGGAAGNGPERGRRWQRLGWAWARGPSAPAAVGASGWPAGWQGRASARAVALGRARAIGRLAGSSWGGRGPGLVVVELGRNEAASHRLRLAESA